MKKKPEKPKPTGRRIQRKVARKVLRAVKQGTGTKLDYHEVFSLWRAFMDYWGDLADESV